MAIVNRYDLRDLRVGQSLEVQTYSGTIYTFTPTQEPHLRTLSDDRTNGFAVQRGEDFSWSDEAWISYEVAVGSSLRIADIQTSTVIRMQLEPT